MLTLAQWIARLTNGYIKYTGKKPDGLAKLKIKMEAAQRVKDQRKVVKGNFNPNEKWWEARPPKVTAKEATPIKKTLSDDQATFQIQKLQTELPHMKRMEVLQLMDDITAKKAYGAFDDVQRKQLLDAISEVYTRKPDFASGGIARVGFAGGSGLKFIGGKVWKDFIEKLFIKTSNDIRQGKGKWKGLTQEQWIKQHDDLTKMLKKWEWGGKKGLPEGAEQFIGMNDLQITKAIKDATKKVKKPVPLVSDDVLAKAYDEVFYQKPVSGDYKYDADVLADSIAEQLGKGSLDDFSQVQQTEIYNTALKRVTQDMQIKKRMQDIKEKIELDLFDTKGKTPHAEGGIAGQLHLNRPGYSGGALVKLFKLLKGAGKKKTNAEVMEEILKNVRKDTSPYKHIDMKKLMKGKDKIKVYSGSVERPSNTWQSFIEDAKMFDTTPEKIAKDRFKDQWFTPFKSYAEGFTSPKDLASKMRTVDLTPKEIAIAKRYVEKINKTDTISMRKKLGLKPYPKHHVTTDDNLVLIPRYKLKELEKTKRMKTDYMILEKLKKKLGLAEGGIAGQLHLNEGGRARHATGYAVAPPGQGGTGNIDEAVNLLAGFMPGDPSTAQDAFLSGQNLMGSPDAPRARLAVEPWKPEDDLKSAFIDKQMAADYDIDAMRDPFAPVPDYLQNLPTYDFGGTFYQNNPSPFTQDFDKWRAAYAHSQGMGDKVSVNPEGQILTDFGNWDPSNTYGKYVSDYNRIGDMSGNRIGKFYDYERYGLTPDRIAEMKKEEAIMNAMYGAAGRGDPRDKPGYNEARMRGFKPEPVAETPVAEDKSLVESGIQAAGKYLDPGKVTSTAGKGMTTLYSGTTQANPFGGSKFYATPDKATAMQYMKEGAAKGSPFGKTSATGRLLQADVPTSQVQDLLKKGASPFTASGATREVVLDPKTAKTVFETGKGAIKGAGSLGTKIALGATKAIPVAGTAITLADAAARAKRGDYVGAGLGTVGALPIVGIPALGAQAAWDYRDKISPYIKKFGSALGEKMAGLREQRGIDPRMAATYAQNRQIMADPRMAGSMGAAKGGLAKVLGV